MATAPRPPRRPSPASRNLTEGAVAAGLCDRPTADTANVDGASACVDGTSAVSDGDSAGTAHLAATEAGAGRGGHSGSH